MPVPVQAASHPSAERPTKVDVPAPKVQVSSSTFEVKAKVSDDLQKITKQIEDVVKELSQYLESNSRNLAIHVDHALSVPVITVKDRFSGEVIRQIPNEVVVKMAHSIDAFKGWLHDERVWWQILSKVFSLSRVLSLKKVNIIL